MQSVRLPSPRAESQPATPQDSTHRVPPVPLVPHRAACRLRVPVRLQPLDLLRLHRLVLPLLHHLAWIDLYWQA